MISTNLHYCIQCIKSQQPLAKTLSDQKETTAFTTRNVTGDLQGLPWLKTRANWKHLSDIPFPKVKERHVDMLIGLDYLDLQQSTREVGGNPGDSTARLTPLGWTCGRAVKANEGINQGD